MVMAVISDDYDDDLPGAPGAGWWCCPPHSGTRHQGTPCPQHPVTTCTEPDNSELLAIFRLLLLLAICPDNVTQSSKETFLKILSPDLRGC